MMERMSLFLSSAAKRISYRYDNLQNKCKVQFSTEAAERNPVDGGGDDT
jgi:hypothetical protein